jgi:hypothetical protein
MRVARPRRRKLPQPLCIPSYWSLFNWQPVAGEATGKAAIKIIIQKTIISPFRKTVLSLQQAPNPIT